VRLALTSSEQAQIGSYVAEGKVATAERVRALVARPDLSADESASALSAAVSPLVFNDPRAAYLHEMLYGPASLPSRGTVAVAVTRALAARADVVMAHHEADLDETPPAIAELTRIFAFLDTDVANAGQPHGAAHDPAAGIGGAAYDDAAKALVTLLAAHPRWLRGEAPIPVAAAPVRGQLELTLLDMTNDTTTRRFDAADRIGVLGPRRAALTELGLLFLDDGHTDGAILDRMRALVARMPGASRGLEALALFDVKTSLRARGDVVTAVVGPESNGAPLRLPPPGSALPPEVFAAVTTLAERAVRRAFELRPDLRAQCEQDVRAASARRPGASPPGGDAVVSAMTEGVQMLTIVGPPRFDDALARLLGGSDVGVMFLSDVLGILAAVDPQSPASLAVGGARATNVQTASAGYVTGLTLEGHAYKFMRAPQGLTARRDGQPITLGMLHNVSTPVSPGTVWSVAGLVFAKLTGSPEAGVFAGGSVKIAGAGSGLDSIVTTGPGDDVAVAGSADPSGETAIVLRVAATPSGFKGVALVLDARSSPLRVSVRAWDDAGKLTELAAPVEVTPPSSLSSRSSRYPVEVSVKGTKFAATVGGTSLHADVPADLPHGDVALAAKHDGSLDLTGFRLRSLK
jgi:hypothetical protein